MYSLDWPRVYGTPASTANFKLVPEDFQVNEFFDNPFSGEGEHIVIKIEKKGLSTEEVVKSLSELINKPTKFISYAGLKDRQALTTQWLSIHTPGEHIEEVVSLTAPGWRVLESTRHCKKLKPGFLSGNQFGMKLREVSNPNDIIQRIEQIKVTGVPNYFGEQRFGLMGGNLQKAEELLVKGRKVKDRFLKGIYCSAARSWLYNLILAERVKNFTWNTPIPGDVMQLSGTHSIFVCDEVDEEMIRRIREKDLAPASPLPGKSKKMVKGAALNLIEEIYAHWQPWLAGMERLGLEESWRANILHVKHLDYKVSNQMVELSFTLPAGSYATTVLRELVLY